MDDWVNEWFEKVCNFIFSKEVGLELVRIIFTGIIGFITFKIYQMYRNKNDNSKLYIKMIKLEKEIIKNLKILDNIIDNHSRYFLLKSLFEYEKEEGVYRIYELINSVNNYVYQNKIYEYGELIGCEYVYEEKPYEIIRDLNNEKNEVISEGEKYNGQLEEINLEIENCENMSIYNLLEKSEKLIKSIDVENDDMRKAIDYLYEKLSIYNKKDVKYKRKLLDEFCSQLIDENNVFAESLADFKELKKISRKINKEKYNKKILNKIEFEIWNTQDMSLLGVYGTDEYLRLEEFYNKYNVIEIGDWQLDRAENLKKEILVIYEDGINKIKNKLKKTLKKTNRLFGKI